MTIGKSGGNDPPLEKYWQGLTVVPLSADDLRLRARDTRVSLPSIMLTTMQLTMLKRNPLPFN
jgi:hypothetical protein